MDIKISLDHLQAEKLIRLLSDKYESKQEELSLKESNTIKSAYRDNSEESIYNVNRINNLFSKLNVKQSNLGYLYIIDALKICMYNSLYLKNLTALLYPILADKYNTTPANIERNIRYQIKQIYYNNDISVLSEILGKNKIIDIDKPLSNLEFLNSIIAKLKLE